MNEIFSFILVRREVTHPSLPCIGFQVDLHVGHQKPPKETPQEKMADVMAIAEVTKEETPGDWGDRPDLDDVDVWDGHGDEWWVMVMSEWVKSMV